MTSSYQEKVGILESKLVEKEMDKGVTINDNNDNNGHANGHANGYQQQHRGNGNKGCIHTSHLFLHAVS